MKRRNLCGQPRNLANEIRSSRHVPKKGGDSIHELLHSLEKVIMSDLATHLLPRE